MATYDFQCNNTDCGVQFEARMSMNHDANTIATISCPICGSVGNTKLLTLNQGGVRVFGTGAYKTNQR